MLVLLPKEADGLPALERKLTTNQVNQWISFLKPHASEIFLPRFKIEMKFNLRSLLETMGMQGAFTGAADFARMSPSGGLSLDEVLHAATVTVDEKGTEAAAATAGRAVLSADDDEPTLFRADHPFIFLIRHDTTGTILFLGRVVDPTGAEA
jgi:serpin B